MTLPNDPVANSTPRVVVVTGASSGIGLAAAATLAAAGDEVVLIGRDPGRLRAATEVVRAAGGRTPASFRADFAVLDEVRALTGQLRAAYPRIDVLANNAGAIFPRRVTTVDGAELTIQTNHLAGFLLTHLLLEHLPPGARIVTTASGAERWGRLDPADLSMTRQRYGRWKAYGSSKQANILFAAEAARRWADRGLVPTSFHPGAVRTRFAAGSTATDLYRFLPFLRTPEEGADTLVWLTHADVAPGGYYVNRRPGRTGAIAADPERARVLWDQSLAAVGL